MKNNQINSGIIITFLTQVITLVSGLLYTPIMLRLLGQSEYGLYQLSTSLISYLSILNFGFSSGYLRFYFRYKNRGDSDGIANLNGMYLVIFLILSFICFLCGMIIIFNVNSIFANGLNKSEIVKIKSLLFILLLNLVINFLSSVFDCYLSSYEKFIFQRGLSLMKAIANPIVSIPFLISGYGSVALCIISLAFTFIVFVMTVVYCLKKLKMKFLFNSFDFSVFKELSNFTFFIFLSTVVNKINLSLDSFLLGRMSGTILVAVYGVGSQINGVFNSLSSTIATLYAPKINRIVTKNSNLKELDNIFINYGKRQTIVLFSIIIGFVFFGKKFINIWAGNNYDESYYVALILMSFSFVSLIQMCGIEIQKAFNLHKVRALFYLIMAFLNIVISILLIKYFGAIGASIGTAIVLVLCDGVFMNLYYKYKIGLDVKNFWLEILKVVIKLSPSILIGLVYNLLGNNTLTMYILFFALFLVVYLLLVKYFFFNNERIIKHEN